MSSYVSPSLSLSCFKRARKEWASFRRRQRSVFGSSGAGGLLAKMTAFMAVLFIVTSLSYNYVSSSHKAQESTILDVRLEDTPKTCRSRCHGSRNSC